MHLFVFPSRRRKTALSSSPVLLCCVVSWQAAVLRVLSCPRCCLSALLLSFGKLFCFPSPCPLCGTRSAHGLLFIAEKPHNETSLRNHTDMYSGESTLASGDLHGLTPFCLTRLIPRANRAASGRVRSVACPSSVPTHPCVCPCPRDQRAKQRQSPLKFSQFQIFEF